MQILLLIGVILILGLAGGRLSERFGIPRVAGYVVVGVLLGGSVTNLLSSSILDLLSPLNSVALAFIGFSVGGEMKYSTFRKYGRQFIIILLSEGVLSMVAVATAVSLWTGNPALGLLLGALSSATAPAATVDVLWEYRSRGPLTTTILAIVALDDGLALVLYGFASSVAALLLSGGPLDLADALGTPALEIFGSALAGVCLGFLLDGALRFFKDRDDQLITGSAAVLLACGVALTFDLSLILTNMVMGLYVTNAHPSRNAPIFEILKGFVPPIYTLFFLFVGARFQLALVPKMGILGLLYLFGRTAGKWLGAFVGASAAGSPRAVRRYLGFALFSQAGVAVGLSLDIYQRFAALGPEGAELGSTVINVIAATTLIVQIIGPPAVKYAISKAGEIHSPREAR